MKQLFALILILVSTQVPAQDSLKSLNDSRNHMTLTGMKVLGTWGVVNMSVGAAGWGVANAGIGLLGYMGAKRNLGKQLTAAESLKAQRAIEKIFLINGGLDFVYIGSGILLNIRGNSRDNAQLKGYGPSLIMQGIFLLLFDAAMYNAQRTNGNKLRGFLEKNTIIFNGNRIGIVYSL
jgi:hypothetical protein